MASGKLKTAAESELAAAIREGIGAGPDEDVSVTTPQFTRPENDPGPAAPPATRADWEALRSTDRTALRERGLRPWGGFVRDEMALGGWAEVEDAGQATHEVWLFPGEWYSAIPAGLEVVDINNAVEKFMPGLTDDDIRFGCLAFGVRIRTDNPDTAAPFKRCACGQTYTAQQWSRLPRLGEQHVPEDDEGPAETLELRLCVMCGSSMAVTT